MLDYLKVFTDWSGGNFSDIKSLKQLLFFNSKLDAAIKSHRAAGLPSHDMSTGGSRCIAFHLNVESDVMNDTDYILVELFGENASMNRMRLTVNFGKDAAKQLGYVWQNKWVKGEIK